MSYNILIELFGSIVNEDVQKDGVSFQDVAEEALEAVDERIGLDDVDKVFTGMNADATYALQDAVENMGLDVDVQAFYPNVNNIAEEDDIEWNQAWKNGFTWRNNKLFVDDEEDDEQDLVEIAVRLGDAGNNGEALIAHARRKGVDAMDINLDELVNKDEAYGDGATEAVAPEPEEAQA